MNKQQRVRLGEARSYIDIAIKIISAVKDEEQDKLDNSPENLQYSERYATIENAIDELEEAIDNAEQAKENIENAC